MASIDYVIDISSDENESDNEVEVLEFKKNTQSLIDNPEGQNHTVGRLSEMQCPICFDEVRIATTTSCGHIFCLECIQQSISSSNANGQVRGARGAGLCPLCRKRVVFKSTIVMRMKVFSKVDAPTLPPGENDEETVQI